MGDNPADVVQQKLQAVRERFAEQLGVRLEELGALARRFEASPDVEVLSELHQRLHSLAGACGMFGFAAIGDTARAIETQARQRLDARAAWAPAEVRDFVAHIQRLAGSEHATASPMAVPAMPQRANAVRDRETPVRIHVIEGDAVLVQELVSSLAQFGYDTEWFESLDASELAALESPPDVLVMDIHFHAEPLTGPEMLQRWRGRGLWLPPVVFVSGRSDFEARMMAAVAGGAAYLTKPVDVPLLAECIEELLPKREDVPPRVLVVDDDPLLTEHYRLVLQGAGMSVQALNRVEGILEVLAGFRPEVILLDLNMPRYSGQDLARMIRQQPEWVGIAITYLSAESSVERQIEALGEAGDDFLSKPISDRQLVAAVAARARRARELSRLAAKDSLTGLLKHSAIKEALVQECARLARNTTRPLSTAMVDIDHFKKVNDTYGHAAGDRVIKALSHLLRQRLRTTDSIGRYGGEEFLVVMTDCGREAAHALLDDIRARFATLQFPCADGVFSCRLSAGVATAEVAIEPATLLNAADAALYYAKGHGRNQVCDAPALPAGDAGR